MVELSDPSDDYHLCGQTQAIVTILDNDREYLQVTNLRLQIFRIAHFEICNRCIMGKLCKASGDPIKII